MSLARNKVEVDPLSFFIEEDHKKLFEDEPEEEVEEPPIQPTKPVVVQKEVKPRGVQFTDPEPVKEEVVKPALKSALKSTTTKAATNQPQQQKPKKDDTSLDVLFSAEYNRKTELLLSAEEDFFASEDNSPKPKSPVPSVTTTSKSSLIDFKKTDDDDISDLQVAKLLEREKGLDEQIFGNKSTTTQKSLRTGGGGAVKSNEFDAEQNFLKELDEITISSKSRIASSLSRSNDSSDQRSAKLSTASIANKKVDIDINSLDINSYINQETNDDGGGLFD